MNNNIFEMELHRTITIKNTLCATRVPGGWIYHYKAIGWGARENAVDKYTSTFVPFIPEEGCSVDMGKE